MQRLHHVRRRFYYLILATSLVLLLYWNILEAPDPTLDFDVRNLFSVELLETNWLYFIILSICFLPVFVFSLASKQPFLQKWKYALLTSILTSIFFIPWDILFTRITIWGFNEKYLSGYNLLFLPVEEWLFFLIIPFCCLMIYDKVRSSGRSNMPYRSVNMYTSFVIVICILLLVTYPKEWYTSSASIVGMCLASGLRATVPKNRLLDYYHAFVWCIIPFLLIDGMLTGLFTIEPIVLYNPLEITTVRIFSIPIEDLIYCYGLLMLSFVVYERISGLKIQSQ